MADQFGNLSPEDFAQQQAITRQQRLATMLMQNTAQPQGQMISGRYVAPSFFQNITPLVNAYFGKELQEKGDTQQLQLAEAIRKRGSEDLQAMFKEYKGTPDQQVPQAGPPSEDMLKQNQFNLPDRTIAGQAPNPMAAVLRGSNSYNPMARQFAGTLLTEMTKPPEYRSQKAGDELIRIKDGMPEVIYSRPEKPEWTASTQFIGGEEVQGWVDKNSPNPAATFIKGSVKPKFSPAEELRLIDEGILKSPQAPVNPAPNNVNLSSLPSKEIIAATESGKAGYDAIFGFPSQGGDPSITKKYGKPLSELTINEVLNEATPRMATNSGAVGRYQFLPSTLKGLLPSVGLTVNDKFSPENQEKLYVAFRQQNSQALKNAGVPTNDLNLHLAHAVGAGNVPLLLNPAKGITRSKKKGRINRPACEELHNTL
jgi:hypothetical protein